MNTITYLPLGLLRMRGTHLIEHTPALRYSDCVVKGMVPPNDDVMPFLCTGDKIYRPVDGQEKSQSQKKKDALSSGLTSLGV